MRTLARGVVGDDGRRPAGDQGGAQGVTVIGRIRQAEAGDEAFDQFGGERRVPTMASADDQASGSELSSVVASSEVAPSEVVSSTTGDPPAAT